MPLPSTAAQNPWTHPVPAQLLLLETHTWRFSDSKDADIEWASLQFRPSMSSCIPTGSVLSIDDNENVARLMSLLHKSMREIHDTARHSSQAWRLL